MNSQYDSIYDNFTSLPAAYRGKPFWSWNGQLDKNELIRQISVFQQMGFGGFFMHSRTGLITQYLGEEWFELINECADEAARLGLEAWLYDEDRWPSGTAGGEVTRTPEFRQKYLKMDIVDVAGFEYPESTVAVFSCRLDGMAFYDCKRINPEDQLECYDDNYKLLVFTTGTYPCESFYNGFTYVDTMNRAATDRFLELTHERYQTMCGDRLGKSISGIFTDEPHRGFLMTEFGAGKLYWVPWTYTLFDEFAKRFDYDLIDRLPDVFLMRDGCAVSQVKWHFVELLQQLFLENFAKPCLEWCSEHNMRLTGHVLHEDSLTCQTAFSGSVMRYYEYMDAPGVDVLTEGNRSYWIVKQLASAARQLGKTEMLSELYGCTGWQMDFAGHKAVGDWQALFGINLRCHHLSWYTMEGEAKRDYPASIAHQSAWWPQYRYVEDYFARIAVMMSAGDACCDVLVINPIESVWCSVYPGWNAGLTAQSQDIKDLEESYAQLFHWLAGAQIDFDYGDEEMIDRLYTIEDTPDGVRLRVGQASYKMVIVSGMTTIRSSTLEILRRFIEAGGQVLFAGNAPQYVDALISNDAVEVASISDSVPFEQRPVTSYCANVAEGQIELTPKSDEIFCQIRKHGDSTIVMLLNVNREREYQNIEVKIPTVGYVEEWSCRDGSRQRIDAHEVDKCLVFSESFAPAQEHVYVIRPSIDASLPVRTSSSTVESYSCDGPFDYELSEPNVCVLDMARYQIDGDKWNGPLEILKLDQQVRDSFKIARRAGDMLQPWFVNLESAAKSAAGRVNIEFEFYIDKLPDTPITLVMERPELFGIRLNGKVIASEPIDGMWIDTAFSRLSLPASALKTGRNVLEIETEYCETSNLEAVYLIGEFGVKIDGFKKRLFDLPAKLMPSDISRQGLPFYSGSVIYSIPVPQEVPSDAEAYLVLPKMTAACARILASDNDNEQMIAFHPMEADISDQIKSTDTLKLEILLTRRNTFGPLHQVPAIVGAYGPGNFTTEGSDFSKNYVLLESGLLAPPQIDLRRTV